MAHRVIPVLVSGAKMPEFHRATAKFAKPRPSQCRRGGRGARLSSTYGSAHPCHRPQTKGKRGSAANTGIEYKTSAEHRADAEPEPQMDSVRTGGRRLLASDSDRDLGLSFDLGLHQIEDADAGRRPTNPAPTPAPPPPAIAPPPFIPRPASRKRQALRQFHKPDPAGISPLAI